MSSDSDAVEPYLRLAELFFHQPYLESELPDLVLGLSVPPQMLFDQLVAEANQIALSQPRWGWAITAVLAEVAKKSSDLWLESMAHWHLARMANEWVQPQRAQEAITRAKVGFQKLEDGGWVWACEWQAHALPWTLPNFQQSAQILAEAVAGIQQSPALLQWLPYARLSLAYAYLLTNNFDLALHQIQQAEETFQTHHETYGLARCYLTYSSLLRRQHKFNDAYTYLTQAMQLFTQLRSPLYQAMAQFQQAFLEIDGNGDYTVAESIFHQAQTTFSEADMPLWVAMCHNGLFQLYQIRGQMALAHQSLEKVRKIYAQYAVLGPQADNLLDIGRFELYRGNYQSSLAYFQQAERAYRLVGYHPSAVVAQMDQGETYFLLGQYQKGLQLIETALSHFQTLGQERRVVESLLILAKVWSQLGQYHKVHTYLDQAADSLKQDAHPYYLSQIYHWRAASLFAEERLEETLKVLQIGLESAQTQSIRRQIALAQRLVGEVLGELHRPQEAQFYLEAATTICRELEMPLDLAECEIANGHCYRQLGELVAAAASWENALRLSDGIVLEICWQAYAGLAGLAEAEGNVATALENYGLAVKSLLKLRRQSWQPALIGAYLRRPATLFQQAVWLAGQANEPELALLFNETSKAQTVAQRLSGVGWYSREVPFPQWNELIDLGTEIRWLQEQIRTSVNSRVGFIRPVKERQMRKLLKEKTVAYDDLLERLERARGVDQPLGALLEFDLSCFRELAGQRLGTDWVALDYYLTNQGVVWVLVTPGFCEVGWRKMPAQIQFIYASVRESAGKLANLSETDLASLGNWLFPAHLSQLLQPHTHLLIAPHNWLHQLPWSALLLTDGIPLMAAGIPTIVPSLHTLTLLWQRSHHSLPTKNRPATGLLLAPFDFQGRHPPLPAVSSETAWLATHLGANSKILQGAKATWHHLQTINQPLTNFDFWHIATHAFHDSKTGRLSGLALHDVDIWLDDLQTLAPLPALVTLSACSGIQQRVYAGDEPVGLTMSCLEAGAHTVVGSLWLTADTDSEELMQQFYTNWFRGVGSATALAKTQRTMWDRGWDWSRWGGFRCVGQPN